jgi:DNA-binding NtrC family response regulator
MSIASVLFVDDEVPFVEALSKRLVKRNLKITPAFSGRQALEVLSRSNDIEVVLLDVKMPGLDGIATLREVKHLHPLVEVVMLTGHATVESAIEGMKLGACDYLMKPCEIDILVAKVSEAAAKKRKHEEKIMQARLKEITTRRA